MENSPFDKLPNDKDVCLIRLFNEPNIQREAIFIAFGNTFVSVKTKISVKLSTVKSWVLK